jgi:hypothetical protein
MQPTADKTNWAGIESEELNSDNWVQVKFRWTKNTEGHQYREYVVFGKLKGKGFRELYDYDESKELAYNHYWEVLEVLEALEE